MIMAVAPMVALVDLLLDRVSLLKEYY